MNYNLCMILLKFVLSMRYISQLRKLCIALGLLNRCRFPLDKVCNQFGRFRSILQYIGRWCLICLLQERSRKGCNFHTVTRNLHRIASGRCWQGILSSQSCLVHSCKCPLSIHRKSKPRWRHLDLRNVPGCIRNHPRSFVPSDLLY